jgi:hypothetical protein
MLDEIQDCLTIIQQSGNNAGQPAWWTTVPDADLATQAPETASVSWWRTEHTVRPDSGSGKSAAINNAAHRFVQLFPEFAGAVTIIETVRHAIGSLRDYPFIQKITALYAKAERHAQADMLGAARKDIAAEFRKCYLSKLPFVRAVLIKELKDGESLSRMLRIHDAIPSEIADAANAGLHGSSGTNPKVSTFDPLRRS